MQLPKRKAGKYTHAKLDPYLTVAKITELTNKLAALKHEQPTAAKEVARLAHDGDFSENAGYQMAKGRLRSINQRILELEYQVTHATIIERPKDFKTVQLGSIVTVKSTGKEKIFEILGSAETDPRKGIISHNSPLGAALMGHSVGDVVKYVSADKAVECKLLKIE